jgi:D-3-phosphoglycerate dehydrogenase
MPHVLLPDNIHQKAIDLLESTETITYDAPGKLSQDDLIAQVPGAHALIIRSGVQITPEVLNAAPELKAIARAGVGVDNIDLAACTEHGVIVMNTPGGNTVSTAEHTFDLMLALARHLPQGHVSLREGRWERKQYVGVELRGKTLGLVGLGRVGQEVAKRAIAFEMTVIAFDPYVPPSVFNNIGVQKVATDELYARSDFISLHAPLMDETRGMINADALGKMKDGVRLVNAARGGLINDDDLAEALKSGKVAGAALDVYDVEPPSDDHPLIGLPNTITTPHLAASTIDAQINVAVQAAQQVIDVLLEDRSANVVNPDVLD